MSNPYLTEGKTMDDQGEIRIYVACLASYNNGILHGTWIDATQGKDGIWREVSQMLLKSTAEIAEVWAIHDHEGFGSIHLSEYTSFETIADYAEFIEEHGDLGAKLIGCFGSLEDAETAISDHYRGQYETLQDFAEEMIEETTVIPHSLQYYIDYEKMARDLEINDVFTIDVAGDCHVFWRF